MIPVTCYLYQSTYMPSSYSSFLFDPHATYEALRNHVLSNLNINEMLYNVKIEGGVVNIGPDGSFEKLRLPINSENEWRSFYHESFTTRGMLSMELHVTLEALNTPNLDLNLSCGGDSSYNPSYDPSPSYNPSCNPPSPFDFFSLNTPASYPQERSYGNYSCGQSSNSSFPSHFETGYSNREADLSPEPCYVSPVQEHEPLSPVMEDAGTDDEDIGATDEGEDGPAIRTDLETGEELSSAEEIEEIFPTTSHDRSMYLSGRTDLRHPVSALCDTSEFYRQESIYGQLYDQDGPLAERRLFANKKELVLAICDYCCKQNVVVRTKDSSTQRLIMICVKEASCAWRLYAKPDFDGIRWVISRNRNPHSCYRDPCSPDHNNLTAELVANCVRKSVRDNLDIKFCDLANMLGSRYPNIQGIKYNKLWRGREIAIQQLFGSWEGAYNILPRILAAIDKTTPGSVHQIVCKPLNDRTKRLFWGAAWAFGPCIAAVEHIRPVISIDGCFLSGRYSGKLLIAIGFALVDCESNETWGWFMQWLRQKVIRSDKLFCVVSDRHKGILNVFNNAFMDWKAHGNNRQAVHRYCM